MEKTYRWAVEWLGGLAAAGFLFFSPQCLAAGPGAPEIRAAVDSAIARVRPALVRIQVVSTDYREGREVKRQAVGSGVIITKDGHLVTNHHVAGHGARMICTLWNREEIEAELIGTDALTDVAVLKLKPVRPRAFQFAEWGDSSTIRVGDTVLAMGSPMALSQSVTLGIISNVEMVMPRGFGSRGRLELDGEDVGSLVRWIGHDAAIYGGNSGGPLVDLAGRVVGVNEISFGLSGAIPGNLARAVARDLMENGKVRRSWIGIDVQPLFKHTEGGRGVVIGGVIEDSPASRAGVTAGDLLLGVAGKETNARYDEQIPDVMRVVTSLKIGRETDLLVMRAGKELKLRITPLERGEADLKQHEVKEWGITARNISFLAAREMKRTNQLGVLVTTVRPGGPAGDAKPPINSDDVLVEVNGEQIDNLEALRRVTKKVLGDKTDPVRVMAAFERGSRRYLTVLAIGIQEMRDPGLEISKAWLPVETAVITREISGLMKIPELRGFYITQVYPGRSAAKAGLQPGDFIVAVDGEKMSASAPEHDEELAALIRQYDIGAKVDLAILRDGKRIVVPVELERSPKLRREMRKYRSTDFEFTARDISFFDIAAERWPADQTGALVEEVKSGSWADLGSMQTGDLIVEVEGQSIKDVAQLKSVMERVTADKRKFLVIKVHRGIHAAFLELEPTW
jgi:serine protease Do